MDMGTVLDGRRAVKEGHIDQLGGLSDALHWLDREIEGEENPLSLASARQLSRGGELFCCAADSSLALSHAADGLH